MKSPKVTMSAAGAAIRLVVAPCPDDASPERLWRQGWGVPPPTGPWQQVLDHCPTHIGAHHGEGLVVTVQVAGDGRGHVFLVIPPVAPDHRRAGRGKALVRLAITWARARGVGRLRVGFLPEPRGVHAACGGRPSAAGLKDLTGGAL